MNQSTPLGVSLYSRYMAAPFDEGTIIPGSTGFLAMFGRPGGYTMFSPDANIVDIDIIKENRTIAPTVIRGTYSKKLDAKMLGGTTFNTITRGYPLIERELVFGVAELTDRRPGESPYSARTRLDRMREMAQRNHIKSARQIVGTMELMASQSILNGKMEAVIGTTNTSLIYDFGRNAGNTITPTIAWDAANCTILADIDKACDAVRVNGKANPDGMLLGKDAMNYFLRDADVRAVADNRRFELIIVSNNNPVPPQFQPLIEGGWIARGRLDTPSGYALWLFTYLDSYNDGTNDVPFMPADEALVFSSKARCDRYFGPSEILPMDPAREAWMQYYFGFGAAVPTPPNVTNLGSVINQSMFYVDAYPSPDFKSITTRTQAAPIYAPTQVDAFALLVDLVDAGT